MRSFAILRRRPTPTDRPAGEVARLGSVLLATIYTRFTRRLGPGPDGRADFLMVGRSRIPLGPGCTARERRLNALARRRFRSQLLVCLNLSCHSLRSIRHGGAFSSSDSGRGPAMLEGLVPDQVARVIAVYPDRPACTVPVRHNVARYLVAHSAPNAFPSRVLFLNGRGKVVGDFPQPASGRSDRYRATACTAG